MFLWGKFPKKKKKCGIIISKKYVWISTNGIKTAGVAQTCFSQNENIKISNFIPNKYEITSSNREREGHTQGASARETERDWQLEKERERERGEKNIFFFTFFALPFIFQPFKLSQSCFIPNIKVRWLTRLAQDTWCDIVLMLLDESELSAYSITWRH